MKHLNSQVKEGRINLKTFPGTKGNQLNHCVITTFKECDYDCATIHVGINDIFRSKDISELKDFPKKLMYKKNIILVRYMLVQFQRRPELSLISVKLTKTKELCHKNNFVFIDHQNITSNDLWVDGIQLPNSGKTNQPEILLKKINKFLCQNSNFQMRKLYEYSFSSTQIKMEGFTTPYRYDKNDKGGGLLLYIKENVQYRRHVHC